MNWTLEEKIISRYVGILKNGGMTFQKRWQHMSNGKEVHISLIRDLFVLKTH